MMLSRALLPVVLLATITALAACGTPSSGPSSPSGGAPTASESSEDKYADWQVINVRDVAEIRLPPDWTTRTNNMGTIMTPPNGVSIGGVIGASLGVSGDDSVEGIDHEAKEYAESSPYPPQRMDDLEVNGTRLFHLRGEQERFWRDDFGTLNEDYLITIGWQFVKADIDRDGADKLINEVMATFRPL